MAFLHQDCSSSSSIILSKSESPCSSTSISSSSSTRGLIKNGVNKASSTRTSSSFYGAFNIVCLHLIVFTTLTRIFLSTLPVLLFIASTFSLCFCSRIISFDDLPYNIFEFFKFGSYLLIIALSFLEVQRTTTHEPPRMGQYQLGQQCHRRRLVSQHRHGMSHDPESLLRDRDVEVAQLRECCEDF